MAYGSVVSQKICRVAELFLTKSSDPGSLERLIAICKDWELWPSAKAEFDQVRSSLLDTDSSELQCQYLFCEVALQTLYNETRPPDPFDSSSPFWVPLNAISLAKHHGIETADIMAAFLARE